MTTIDLTPLYRNSIGFDRFGSLLDNALRGEQSAPGYPPYNIEIVGENQYSITLAVAGFERNELDIQVDSGVLQVHGKKQAVSTEQKFFHQGIATRSFDRKFNLADYIEVTGADLNNGLLCISLKKEIPEAMKPRSIKIAHSRSSIEHSAA